MEPENFDPTLGWKLSATGGLAHLTDEGVREFAKNEDGSGWTEFVETPEDVGAIAVTDANLIALLDAKFSELAIKENN
jgi:hypothetical protein